MSCLSLLCRRHRRPTRPSGPIFRPSLLMCPWRDQWPRSLPLWHSRWHLARRRWSTPTPPWCSGRRSRSCLRPVKCFAFLTSRLLMCPWHDRWLRPPGHGYLSRRRRSVHTPPWPMCPWRDPWLLPPRHGYLSRRQRTALSRLRARSRLTGCRRRRRLRPSSLHPGQRLVPVWWGQTSKCPCRRASRSSQLRRCTSSSRQGCACSLTCVGMIVRLATSRVRCTSPPVPSSTECRSWSRSFRKRSW
mmetsp:Transcript_4143/g.8868  ORF Transcript_4143/g.8868 Transcript_4143/m.8868 type:complete len:245 (-) Transcript_4143:332-1066(-)